ncbi:MAG: hypothetical protein HY420_03315 [Candidatus Kerfeldbacteria bacterium]|nr:hypothetical protein [Candidatus Kerfeldbacteria bacterium]
MNQSTKVLIGTAVILLLGVGVWWGVDKNKSSQTPNANYSTVNTTNVNRSINYNGSIAVYSSSEQEYMNNQLGISFRFPNTYTVTEDIGQSNGVDIPVFSIDLGSNDPSLGSGLMITNRAVGFEEETILKNGSTTIDGKAVKWVVSSEETNKVTHFTKRYLFSPLNLGNQYSEYWIAFPVDRDGKNDVYEKIVQSIKLLK